MKIYKYRLSAQDEITMPLPKGVQILSVIAQDGQLCVYAKVPDAKPVDVQPMIDVRFSVRGTGHPLSGTEGEFLGTAQIGPFVWHVFYQS